MTLFGWVSIYITRWIIIEFQQLQYSQIGMSILKLIIVCLLLFCWGLCRTWVRARRLLFGVCPSTRRGLWGWLRAWRLCLWGFVLFNRWCVRRVLLRQLSSICVLPWGGLGWWVPNYFLFFLILVRYIFWIFLCILLWLYCSGWIFLGELTYFVCWYYSNIFKSSLLQLTRAGLYWVTS